MKIERLKIGSTELEDQLHFYRNILGLEILHQDDNSFEVRAGYSTLEFHLQNDATPYHIAFHIPAYGEELALRWLKDRTSILQDEGKEIVDFPNWNARSVYFHDAGKNILEFISRRHCFPAETDAFTTEAIVGISEIGLATSDVRKVFDFLNSNFQLQKFTGDHEVFCATGDDEGLFIVIDKNKKDWFPSGDEAFASDFEIQISTVGRTATMAFKNDTLKLL